MQKLSRRIRKYPLVFLFFLFLMGVSLLDPLWPKRDRSELENRTLSQLPTPSWETLWNNQWMAKYESYVKDQFILRDQWINLKSATETGLLKTENGGVWLGKDHYLFAKQIAIGDLSRYEKNQKALQKFCESHPGAASVMIVPSASLILKDKLPFAAPVLDEERYLDDLFASLSGSATVYDVRDVLSAHADEDIYYRTDHHWTTLGAYYAYTQFAEANSLTPFDLQSAPIKTVPDFYGTNYSKARTLGTVPDTITYYDLPNTLTVYPGIEEQNGTAGTLYDTEKFETRDKYAAFLRGNNGYSVLEGNGEGSILIVKDSYANSFIPFLTANYAKIGIIDFRSLPNQLSEVMAADGYEKVLFLYSFDAFTSDAYFAGRIVK